MASLRPWLEVADATAAVAFYATAFGAETVEAMADGDTIEVALLRVGEAEFWVQRSDTTFDRSPVRMIIEVADPDAAVAVSVGAGAELIAEVHDEHGWRSGRVRDPAGLDWELARSLE